MRLQANKTRFNKNMRDPFYMILQCAIWTAIMGLMAIVFINLK